MGSIDFIQCIQSIRPSFLRWNHQYRQNIAFECGAGIGRITKYLLLSESYAHVVPIDMCHSIESSSKLLYAAPEPLIILVNQWNPHNVNIIPRHLGISILTR